MDKGIVLMVGIVSLFAGIAQADTLPCDDPGYNNGGHFSGWTDRQCEATGETVESAGQKEASMPEPPQAKEVTALKAKKTNSGQESQP